MPTTSLISLASPSRTSYQMMSCAWHLLCLCAVCIQQEALEACHRHGQRPPPPGRATTSLHAFSVSPPPSCHLPPRCSVCSTRLLRHVMVISGPASHSASPPPYPPPSWGTSRPPTRKTSQGRRGTACQMKVGPLFHRHATVMNRQEISCHKRVCVLL